MLERAFVERSTRQQEDRTMTEILNSKFPLGTDEAELKVALIRQGFKYLKTREMQYDIARLGIVCGTNYIFVNWSVDDDGKLTRLEAFERIVCW